MKRLSSKDQECMETDVGDITNLNVIVLSSDNQSILALASAHPTPTDMPPFPTTPVLVRDKKLEMCRNRLTCREKGFNEKFTSYTRCSTADPQLFGSYCKHAAERSPTFRTQKQQVTGHNRRRNTGSAVKK
ncbi:uncharacterized protein LOC143244639 isoform X2 [Tachypleus tridentatus]|uniref:uncharacterized protein LOC143244639 isoform X2 n=1 Tax=Tachypleus tridentatus TaxID=6853 RepID=UPI003FD054BA